MIDQLVRGANHKIPSGKNANRDCLADQRQARAYAPLQVFCDWKFDLLARRHGVERAAHRGPRITDALAEEQRARIGAEHSHGRAQFFVVDLAHRPSRIASIMACQTLMLPTAW